MAVNDIDPTTGHPIFYENEASELGADLTAVAAYAAKVGNCIIGTTAQRNAYPQARKGLLWSDLDTDIVYRHNGTGWVDIRRVDDTGWVSEGLATEAQGWTLVEQTGRRVGISGYLALTFERVGGTITVPQNGNIANQTLGTIVDPRFVPTNWVGTYSGATGRDAAGAIASTGAVTLGAVGGGGVDIVNGDVIQTYNTGYFVE